MMHGQKNIKISWGISRVGWRGRYWGSTGQAVRGDWRKLRNEELLLSFPNFILVLKSRRMGPDRERGGAHRILFWNPERQSPLGRNRRWRENNILLHYCWRAWIGLRKSGVVLWTRWWTFGLH